ncbi:MarR family winged helix-turn-helix transcriptional regulator [Rudaeicoccus suwonensis]|uniref:DNA-binding MarR family transcriptional regulator n=1 Tax=Rudaeicoccus suwonensis TaxID=657409 RepID=A0A561E6L8_9MICO|nr:MarR family transcriptional regulator [Rudaeicoccus suwonensis]TWE11266.1 DNA-binding MarR family transcriptional regulator [Rudaeicoccus suwonensis]
MPQRVQTWRDYLESSILLQTALDDQLRADSQMSLLEYHLLLLLSEATDRRLRMGDLAREMVFSSSRLTYQVGVLEKRGWVRRDKDTTDARSTWACLTDDGVDVLRQASRGHLQAVRSLFLDALDDDEVAVLGRVFARQRQRLRELGV